MKNPQHNQDKNVNHHIRVIVIEITQHVENWWCQVKLWQKHDSKGISHDFSIFWSLSSIYIIATSFTELSNTWGQVLKNGRTKICGKQPLKIWSDNRPYYFNFFKGCLPQILLGPFWNTLSQILTYLITFWTFMQQFFKKFRDFSTIYCFFPPQVHWKCFQVTVSFCHRLCTQ